MDKESLEKAQLPGPLIAALMEINERMMDMENILTKIVPMSQNGTDTSELAGHPCRCDTCQEGKSTFIEQVVRQTERRIFQELADAASRFNLGNEADRLASAYLEHTGRGITTDSLLVEA